MSTIRTSNDPQKQESSLPESLRKQLGDFQRYVWRSKMLEVFGLAATGLGIGFLTVFIIDRWVNTSTWIRIGIALAVTVAWSMLPLTFHRWVWQYRRFDQLANLIRRRSPTLGDELLGVIELSESVNEQNRSPALCAAAIQQVASQTAKRNLLESAPQSQHAKWLRIAASIGVVTVLLLLILPSAAWNALARLAFPWRQIERYTFAQVEPLPKRLVVAHGETFSLQPTLATKTVWSPPLAKATLSQQPEQKSKRTEQGYPFQFAALNREANLQLRVGDYTHSMTVEPKLRPELASLQAEIQLPAYLQLPKPIQRDLRGGNLSVVAGANVVLKATANRPIVSAEIIISPRIAGGSESSATLNHEVAATSQEPAALPASASLSVVTDQENITSSPIAIRDGLSQLFLSWIDADGLAAKQPARLTIQGIEDASPMVSVENLPRNTIVLNTEQLNFQIISNDDFGVKEVGLEWWADDEVSEESPKEKDRKSLDWRRLGDGGPDQTSLLSQGTFRPIDWGIESQAIELKAWAVDYRPDRGRSYSTVHRLLVLTPDEHAVWLTEQINQWHRQSLDVRDRELQLYEANRELRDLPREELASQENRRRLEEQASAEAANERRLKGLANAGERLLKQAARNPEFGVGHLERLAEMLKLLQGIANNRMPKVTDLLQQEARDSGNKSGAAKPSGPAAGQIRTTAAGKPSEDEPPPPDPKAKPMPKLTDLESTMQPASKDESKSAGAKKKGSGSKFTLPKTTLMGPPQASEEKKEEDKPEESKLDAAVREQEELLAEFDKLADELSNILGELEGSTLVKRLKAASRDQLRVAQEVTKRLQKMLGNQHSSIQPNNKHLLEDLIAIESKGSEKVSNIIDDLEAFQERRRLSKFENVLAEMKESQVVGSLRVLSDDLPREQGMSIAQAEYWADTLDRWAEDLVDPACKGNCPGCKNSDALPPSIVLEVLQILEGQVNLREETRVVEQAKKADALDLHRNDAKKLATRQEELDKRIVAVNDKIRALPESEKRFSDEIQRLDRADDLMLESIGVFNTPESGKPSMAIQTEIIELLLESKRINPKSSGGGGGAAPGGGGQGDTTDAALALIGAGLDLKSKSEARDIQQTTGANSSPFPEEFRDGLNQYFNRLEKK